MPLDSLFVPVAVKIKLVADLSLHLPAQNCPKDWISLPDYSDWQPFTYFREMTHKTQDIWARWRDRDFKDLAGQNTGGVCHLSGF